MQREREQLLGDMAATLRQYHGASSPSSQEFTVVSLPSRARLVIKNAGFILISLFMIGDS